MKRFVVISLICLLVSPCLAKDKRLANKKSMMQKRTPTQRVLKGKRVHKQVIKKSMEYKPNAKAFNPNSKSSLTSLGKKPMSSKFNTQPTKSMKLHRGYAQRKVSQDELKSVGY